MEKLNKKIVWEAVKEPLRLFVLAIIPFCLAYFSVIDAQWAVIITVALRFIDKLLHEIGKEVSTKKVESSLVGGITRF